MCKSNVPVSLRYTVKNWSIVYLVSPSVPHAGCGFLIAGVSPHSWSSFLDCPLEKTPGITGKLLNIWIYLDRKYTTKHKSVHSLRICMLSLLTLIHFKKTFQTSGHENCKCIFDNLIIQHFLKKLSKKGNAIHPFFHQCTMCIQILQLPWWQNICHHLMLFITSVGRTYFLRLSTYFINLRLRTYLIDLKLRTYFTDLRLRTYFTCSWMRTYFTNFRLRTHFTDHGWMTY